MAIETAAALRRAGGVLAAIAMLVVLAVPASSTGALPSPTGDPHGIVLARAVGAALAHVRAVAYEQSGFAWMLSERGPRPAFRWRWGAGPVAGMVPVHEQATVGLKDGLVSWWRDYLTPLPCGDAALCGPLAAASQVAAEIVVLPYGTFYAYGDRTSHSCFGRLGGSTPQRVGEPTWSAFGQFQPPAGHGDLELLKSIYPWSLTGGFATEAAALSLHTHLPVHEQTTIAPPAGRAFSFNTALSYPAHARAPHPNLCAG